MLKQSTYKASFDTRQEILLEKEFVQELHQSRFKKRLMIWMAAAQNTS